jgi:hypothetical protein
MNRNDLGDWLVLAAVVAILLLASYYVGSVLGGSL